LADAIFNIIAGIGTYASGSDKVNVGPLGRISRWFSQLMDQGLGNTFDEHVLAGYKFLMRYYSQGDQIYIFGFSRGAFTARFLARMVATVGLLSKGNEEMVSFAYRSYQSYEQGTGGKTREEHEKFFEGFKETFCRDNVLVHFLGLFDTVRSVSTFDAPWVQPSYIPTYNSYATHVRHAVAVDERRSKFKPALLCEDHKLLNLDEEEDAEEQDSNAESEGSEDINAIPKEQKRGEDIKEVWFPGNHGDIGGGWPNPSGSEDGTVQLSALPLEWMVKELRAVPVKEDAGPIQLNHFADDFLKCIGSDSRRAEALTSTLHDVMNFSGGGSRFGVLFWTMMGEHFLVDSISSLCADPFSFSIQTGSRSLDVKNWRMVSGSRNTGHRIWVALVIFQKVLV
jgi:uncharacterized protein (DUF2235 family)